MESLFLQLLNIFITLRSKVNNPASKAPNLVGSLSNYDSDSNKNVHLKSEFVLSQTLSRLLHLVQFVKCWHFFLELNSKGLCQSIGKEKESNCCCLFTSSSKHEIRHFCVVVMEWRQRNVQKTVMRMQSCCFGYQIYWFLAILITVVIAE